MLSQGHPYAARYPIWQLYLEAELAEQRENVRLASEASLINNAINAAFDQETAKKFSQTLRALDYREGVLPARQSTKPKPD